MQSSKIFRQRTRYTEVKTMLLVLLHLLEGLGVTPAEIGLKRVRKAEMTVNVGRGIANPFPTHVQALLTPIVTFTSYGIATERLPDDYGRKYKSK